MTDYRCAASVMLAAVLAACSPSIESDSGTVRSGESLELEVAGAKLTIPPGELPGGLRVKLSAQVFDSQDDPPKIARDMVLTPVISTSFDAVEPAVGDFTVEVALPESASEHIYVLQRTRGGLLTDGVTDTGWLLGFGYHDKQRSVLSVPLASTAESISIIVVDVGAPPVSLHRTLQPLSKYVATGIGTMLGVSEASAQETDSPPGASMEMLTSRGWVVFCQPENLSDPRSCSLTDVQLDALAQLAVDSSAVLRDLGFSVAYLRVLSRDAIKDAPGRYALAESESSAKIPNEYFVLVFDKNLEHVGLYNHTIGVPYIRSDVRRATIHEILHAVQLANTIYLYLRNWYVEGTAAAIEPLAPGIKDPNGTDYHYEGEWRDWSDKLSDNRRDVSYETGEFWQSIDGTMKYLPGLYSKLDSATTARVTDSPQDYELIDTALRGETNTGLADTYFELIKVRSRSEYPHCDEVEAVCEGNECPVGDPFYRSADPMAALCLKVTVKPDELDCDKPNLTLELDGDEATHRFIVDEEPREIGEKITVPEEFKLWIVNVAFDESDSSIPEAIVKADCPLPVQIAAQVHVVAVRTTAVLNCPAYSTGPGCPILEELVDDEGFEQSADLGDPNIKTTTWRRTEPHTVARRDVRTRAAPVGGDRQFSKMLSAEGATPSMATARLKTSAVDHGGEFVIEGSYRVAAKGADAGGWFGSAGAEVEYTVQLTLGLPANVIVSNCDLFDVGGSLQEISRRGDECEFSGLMDADMMKIMQEMDYESILGPEMGQDYQDAVGRIGQGDWIVLIMRAESFESSESAATDAEEQFRIRIVPK